MNNFFIFFEYHLSIERFSSIVNNSILCKVREMRFPFQSDFSVKPARDGSEAGEIKSYFMISLLP